jgi:hypothetical protein
VTRQIGADANLDGRRRRQVEVRKEAGDAVNVMKRDLQTLSELSERIRGQVSMLSLNRAQFVDDDGGTASAPTDASSRQPTAVTAACQLGPAQGQATRLDDADTGHQVLVESTR